MRIRNIKIEHIRGIDTREFSVDIHPNTPTFFVAPNGFGKSSIATAFNLLNRNRIDIQDENQYQNDRTLLPLITITDDTGIVYQANSTSNTINETFSICVINSQLKPQAKTRRFGGFAAATPSLIVEPIILYNRIPDKTEFSYSYSDIKRELGNSAGKLLINLSTLLNKSKFARRISAVKTALTSLCQVRNANKIGAFLSAINNVQGTKEEIANLAVDTNSLLEIDAVNAVITSFDFLFSGLSINEKLVNTIQLRKLYKANEDRFSRIIDYYDYVSDKEEINELLGFFNCTWKNIAANKKGAKFVLEFPNANQISNGERDVLCFIGKLFEARSKLRKEKNILIIDEIFDYLDDANIIAAQYFLTKFIEQSKEQGKELFLIILTHLDPMFFNTYSFSIKNVVYLNRTNTFTNKHKINNLLKDRDRCQKQDSTLYNRISSNYLHYSTDNTDDSAYLRTLGIEAALFTPESFHRTAVGELDNYRNNTAYDPALVCCGLRLYIEEKAFAQLSVDHRLEFLGAYKKTTDKLAFAKEKGAAVPEVHFLLSIIYNEAMHLDSQCQRLHPITYKLQNKVIRNMIVEA